MTTDEWKARIDTMDRIDMARLRRFAPVGHPIFCTDTDLPSYFERRFQQLGGMTSTISKMIDDQHSRRPPRRSRR